MGPYGILYVYMRPDGFQWDVLGPYRSVCVLIDFHASLKFLMLVYGC